MKVFNYYEFKQIYTAIRKYLFVKEEN